VLARLGFPPKIDSLQVVRLFHTGRNLNVTVQWHLNFEVDLDDDGNSSRTIIIKHNIGVRVKQRDTLAPSPALLFKLRYIQAALARGILFS
jgi:hypothetical protein